MHSELVYRRWWGGEAQSLWFSMHTANIFCVCATCRGFRFLPVFKEEAQSSQHLLWKFCLGKLEPLLLLLLGIPGLCRGLQFNGYPSRTTAWPDPRGGLRLLWWTCSLWLTVKPSYKTSASTKSLMVQHPYQAWLPRRLMIQQLVIDHEHTWVEVPNPKNWHAHWMSRNSPGVMSSWQCIPYT